MHLLNRAILHVAAADPLRTWAVALQQQGVPVNMDFTERSSYLLGLDLMVDVEKALAPHVAAIFEHELRWVCRERQHWPADRSVAMFLSWFNCSCHSVCFDLLDTPMRRELFV